MSKDQKGTKFNPNGSYPSIEKNAGGDYDIKQDGRVYGSGRTEDEANKKASKLWPF